MQIEATEALQEMHYGWGFPAILQIFGDDNLTILKPYQFNCKLTFIPSPVTLLKPHLPYWGTSYPPPSPQLSLKVPNECHICSETNPNGVLQDVRVLEPLERGATSQPLCLQEDTFPATPLGVVGTAIAPRPGPVFLTEIKRCPFPLQST